MSKGMRRWAQRGVLAMAAFLGLATAGLAWAYPPLGAAACPACYGFERAAPSLILPRDADPALADRLSGGLVEARLRAEALLGPSEVRTVFIGCPRAACYGRMGGKGVLATTYSTPFGAVVRVSPRGLNPTILAHEMAHAVIHDRVGFPALASGALPAWFDEGLATIVSNDERYLGAGTDAGVERCIDPPGGPLPTSPFEWAPMGGRDPHLYARAVCAVLEWMDANGGWPGTRAALAEVGEGARRLP